jgi:hypothetical protein
MASYLISISNFLKNKIFRIAICIIFEAKHFAFGVKAIAQEYKDSLEIESDPQKKEKWLARQKILTDRQIRWDMMRLSAPDVSETDEDAETT